MKTCLFYLWNILLISVTLISCRKSFDVASETKRVDDFMSNWHLAATNADTVFFDFLDADAVYIGTDATERWTKSEFETFALPYFKKGKAWDFKTIERKVYFSEDKNIAWFNETLDTWMGICRSSGVLQKYENEGWKIKHYHLSCAVPNDKMNQFIELVEGNEEKQAKE